MDARLTPLTPPQPDCLAVFLELRYQGIPLFYQISILFILVIWPVRFDNSIDTIDGARNPVCRDELSQIPVRCELSILRPLNLTLYIPI